MADLPLQLDDAELARQLAAALDVEGKIPAALASMAPVAGRSVALVGGGEVRAAQLAALGAIVTQLDWDGDGRLPIGDGTFDSVVSCWSGFREPTAAELAEVDRVLGPGGRLLIVHDYGRDDVSLLHGERPEYGAWSRRNGPFLGRGFRIRVLHCWWTFPGVEEAAAFLEVAFGEAGAALAVGLRRPRLSYNVAIYHRARGEGGDRLVSP
jgi:SAM-dependent methyltransferase